MLVAVDVKSSSAYVHTLSVPMVLILSDSRKLAFVLLQADSYHLEAIENPSYLPSSLKELSGARTFQFAGGCTLQMRMRLGVSSTEDSSRQKNRTDWKMTQQPTAT